MTDYHGPERRKNSMSEDHDILTRMDVKLDNLSLLFTNLSGRVEEHILKDEKSFDYLNKIVWGLGGAGAVIAVLIKLIK